MTQVADVPEKPPKPVMLGQLDTFPRVRRAIARVTKAVLAGDLAPDRAAVVIRGLAQITASLREEILEAGLRELEVRAGLRFKGMPSGVAHEQLVGFQKRRHVRQGRLQ